MKTLFLVIFFGVCNVQAENQRIKLIDPKLEEGIYVLYSEDSGRKESLSIKLSSGESAFAERLNPAMIEDMEIRVANGKLFLSFDLKKDFNIKSSNLIYIQNTSVKFFMIQMDKAENEDIGVKTFYFVDQNTDEKTSKLLDSSINILK